MYDIIIIGAGPAGLTAATNTSNRGLKTLLIEQYEKPGGQPLIFYPDKLIKDHPGFPVGVLGKEFARLLEMQALNAGAEIRCNEEALKIGRKEDHLELRTNNAVYQAKRIIICTGLLNVPNKLSVLSNYKGEGVFYKIGSLSQFKGRNVVVIGGGQNAFDIALQLKEVAGNVGIVVRHEYARATDETVREAERKGIVVHYNSELVGIENKEKVTKATIVNTKTNHASETKADAIFSAIGFSTVNKFLQDNGIEQNKDGSIKTSGSYETSIPGVFAAGDVNGEVKVIAVACARGIEAAVHTFSSIKKPYWLS